MPNHQKHRGQHTSDKKWFAPKELPKLMAAVRDLSYLQEQDYPEKSALALVGDRYQLSKRQRQAVLRAACGPTAQYKRFRQHFAAELLPHESVAIDTYNLLISVETALSDGIILHCQDGCYRDLASIHGTYRKVEETLPALRLIGKVLNYLKVPAATWYLDQPVSNSGRLKQLILAEAQAEGWQWEAELLYNPDKALVEQRESVVISSDSWVIEHTWAWFNLLDYLIANELQNANILSLNC